MRKSLATSLVFILYVWLPALTQAAISIGQMPQTPALSNNFVMVWAGTNSNPSAGTNYSFTAGAFTNTVSGIASNIASQVVGSATNVPGASNSMFLNGNPPQAFRPTFDLPQMALWLSAQQTFLTQFFITNGQAPYLRDYSPSNWAIISNLNSTASWEWYDKALNGTPGFYLPPGGAELMLSNILYGVTNFTLAMTFRDMNGTNNQINYIATAGGGVGINFPYAFRASPGLTNSLRIREPGAVSILISGKVTV